MATAKETGDTDNNECDTDQNGGEKKTFLPGFSDITEYSQGVFRALMQAIKSSNDLPSAGDDFDYYSSFQAFRRLMDVEGARLLQLIQQIMKYHGAKGNLASSSQLNELEDKYDILVDANDQLLERVGTYLDEAAGLRKQESPLVVATMGPKQSVSGSWNKKLKPGSSAKKGSSFRLLAAKNIQRPQAKFKDKIDNSYRPFVPRIKDKPNALKSLSESLRLEDSRQEDIDDDFVYPHPYEYELLHFKPAKELLHEVEPQEPKSLEECPVSMVDTLSALQDLCTLLKTQTEIAVDLEHHSYRSYLGFTCLMQISTRAQDFLVDTLELRSELHLLNDVFTDPAIVKVFHGADMDVQWLQRDLGLYVVNLFDTGQAARLLQMARFSLAHLLDHFCGVTVDKQYQLADWRIRPLPEELVHYAREDTHYLLYVYDRMKNQLIERSSSYSSQLESVWSNSAVIAMKKFVKPRYTEQSYKDLCVRSKKMFNSQQLDALMSIHSWRDRIARQEDESTGYVLPNHMLLQVCEILPREPQGILACCNPIPPLVRQSLAELHEVIMRARDQPLVKLVTPAQAMKGPTRAQHPKYDRDSLLHAPHDASHKHIIRDNVTMETTDISVKGTASSTMFKDKADVLLGSKVKVKDSPILTAFAWKTPVSNVSQSSARRKALELSRQLPSPFAKYMPEPVIRVPDKPPLLRPQQKGMKWVLLPNTKRPKAAPSMPPTVKEVAVQPMIISDTEEDVLSLRQQMPSKHKRRTVVAAEEEETAAGSPSPKMMKGSKDGEVRQKAAATEAVVKDFQPHDYSKADYKLFEGGSTGGKKRPSHYDPSAGDHSRKGGARNRGKQHQSGHKQSVTYSGSDKSKALSKIHWPK